MPDQINEHIEINDVEVPVLRVPLGTIITSSLEFEKYSKVANGQHSSDWDPSSSRWSPADGRDVKGSQYDQAGFGNTVLDTRGVFLRGINQIDKEETSSVPVDQQDPAGIRPMGSFQDDMFEKHNHSFNVSGPFGNQWGHAQGNQSNHSTGGHTAKVGGEETRPKNIAVYFYIRINN